MKKMVVVEDIETVQMLSRRIFRICFGLSDSYPFKGVLDLKPRMCSEGDPAKSLVHQS